MKDLYARITSKDIINGNPMASCVVTHDGQFVATVKYNYFSAELVVEYLSSQCIPPDGESLSGYEKLLNQIKLSVLQCISSESRNQVNRMLDTIAFKEHLSQKANS